MDLLKELRALIDAGIDKIHWHCEDGGRSGLYQPFNNMAKIGSGSVVQRDWDNEPQPSGGVCNLMKGTWATTKQDTGKIPMDPISVPGPNHEPRKQYPIKPEAHQAVQAIVQDLEDRGRIRPTKSTTNSPRWLNQIRRSA